MAKKKWTIPERSAPVTTDLDAALSLLQKTHDDVMAFASYDDRVSIVIYPGPKHVFTREQIEAEKVRLSP
jgi:hypothetical protein